VTPDVATSFEADDESSIRLKELDMKTTLFLLLVALALSAAGAFAQASEAIDEVNDCPANVGNPNIAEPWVRVAVGDANGRLADRNGDGVACKVALLERSRVVGTVWTDNSIGDPHIIPPGPCTDPFREVGIGDPNVIGDPSIRQIDANGDGLICGSAQLEARALILILLDNPNAVGDPHI
jgi:hypothetical protein